MRTSRKGFSQQMTQIERRQARIRRIRSQLQSSRVEADFEEGLSDAGISASDPTARYHIGKTQNHPEHIIPFIERNKADPAIKVG